MESKILKVATTILLCLVCGIFNSHSQEKEFDWLIGTWQNSDNETSYESWTKDPYSEKLMGKGYKVLLKDTLVFETITIAIIEGDFYYIPDVVDNDGAVPFKILKYDSKGFYCENTMHDFPKAISYKIKAGNMEAQRQWQARGI